MADQPLWLAMEEAFLAGRQPGFNDRFGYAAEIEAIRDRIVPEEPEPTSLTGVSSRTSRIPHDVFLWCRWDERQRIRARLTAEAEKARAGE
jgi:hypothetical protein